METWWPLDPDDGKIPAPTISCPTMPRVGANWRPHLNPSVPLYCCLFEGFQGSLEGLTWIPRRYYSVSTITPRYHYSVVRFEDFQGSIEGLTWTPRYHYSVVMWKRFRGCNEFGIYDCRKASVSRTAVRLIIVEIAARVTSVTLVSVLLQDFCSRTLRPRKKC